MQQNVQGKERPEERKEGRGNAESQGMKGTRPGASEQELPWNDGAAKELGVSEWSEQISSLRTSFRLHARIVEKGQWEATAVL